MMNVKRTVVSTEAQAIEKTHVYNLTFNNENGVLSNVNCEVYSKEYPEELQENFSDNASLTYVGRIAKSNGRQSIDLSADEDVLTHLQHFNSYLNQYEELVANAKAQKID